VVKSGSECKFLRRNLPFILHVEPPSFQTVTDSDFLEWLMSSSLTSSFSPFK
jgi:hypothetical protein